MKALRFSDAQKAFILKQGAEGTPVADNMPQGWDQPGDGLLPSEMRRLRQLEDENSKLRKVVGDNPAQVGPPKVELKANNVSMYLQGISTSSRNEIDALIGDGVNCFAIYGDITNEETAKRAVRIAAECNFFGRFCIFLPAQSAGDSPRIDMPSAQAEQRGYRGIGSQ